MLFVFIDVYWCPTRFPYQIMFVSFNSNTTGVTSGAGTANPSGAPEFISGFRGVHVARSLVFYVMFCRSVLVLFLLAIVLSVILWYLQIFRTHLLTYLWRNRSSLFVLKTIIQNKLYYRPNGDLYNYMLSD
jgi:hypothetical protein